MPHIRATPREPDLRSCLSDTRPAARKASFAAFGVLARVLLAACPAIGVAEMVPRRAPALTGPKKLFR